VLISRLATIRVLRQGQGQGKVTFSVGILFDVRSCPLSCCIAASTHLHTNVRKIRFRDFLLWHFGSGVEQEADHLLRQFLRIKLSSECPSSLQVLDILSASAPLSPPHPSHSNQDEPNLVRAVDAFHAAFHQLVSAPRLDVIPLRHIMVTDLNINIAINKQLESAMGRYLGWWHD